MSGVDEAEALVRFRAENATQLVLGATGRSRLDELLRGSVVNRVVREAAPIDVHVISPKEPPGPGLSRTALRHRPAAVAPRRRDIALFLATVGIASLAAVLSPLQPSLRVPGALVFMLLGVVLVATLGGLVPALVATVLGGLSTDFFFVPPFDSLRPGSGLRFLPDGVGTDGAIGLCQVVPPVPSP